MMCRIGLVGWVKEMSPFPQPPRDLYASTLFRGTDRLSDKDSADVYIPGQTAEASTSSLSTLISSMSYFSASWSAFG